MSSAEIYDRGYRSYDGPRSGISSSMQSVGLITFQRALGLRRKFRFKIVPLLTIVIAYLPAVAFMGIALLLPSEIAGEVVPEYAGYFGLISISMVLLTAFVVPEVMGSDRRTGMFGLYMASPLQRTNYLVSKFLAIILVMSLVTMLPVVFQLAGYSFLELGPEGFGGIMKTLLRITVSGFVLSVFFTLFGMAASTLTSRSGFASAGIVMTIIASGVLTDVLVEVADAPKWARLFGFVTLPLDVIQRIFNETNDVSPIEGVSDLTAYGAWFGACALFAVITWFGYRRLEVTK